MQIGDKVCFVPNGFGGDYTQKPLPGKKDPPPRKVTGKVVYVNEPHRYYLVEAEVNDIKIKESFKF